MSVRELCLKAMCASENVSIDPLTWNVNYALQRCSDCPKLHVFLPSKAKKIEVNYSIWDKSSVMMRRKGNTDVK